jgi:uncharacterized integral membrane protein (TIGR00698 family)
MSLVSRAMLRRFSSRAPGLAAVLLVSLAAHYLGIWESRALGRTFVDPLVLAILIGLLARAALGARESLENGVNFAAKDILEVAVVLLGASVNLAAMHAAGLPLAIGLVLFVAVSVIIGISIGRMLGLSPQLSVLIACGNAICGNSAIAAVAPSINASREDTASAVAFTALLGMLAVFALPLLMIPLGLTHQGFGVVAGSTVYAVPQVLAAAYPVSDAAGEMATLVKLTRVLLLGPVVITVAAWLRRSTHANTAGISASRGLWVPWFILGFAVLATLRATGLLSIANAELASDGAHRLTLAAMAGLGLSVDLREVRRVGARAAVAASVGLLLMLALALLLVRVAVA